MPRPPALLLAGAWLGGRGNPSSFALNENRPLFAFAGIWTAFGGDRGIKSKPIPGRIRSMASFTTEADAVVKPIHPKAMPLILTADEERDPQGRFDTTKTQGRLPLI